MHIECRSFKKNKGFD